ncbi:MAG: peroxide stress protein YaaA [Streptosporangiales bacterium]|nr:peroxide stress protein YaaA [Streptosporangiales bacterium]
MLVLLPPSEGKETAGDGPPLDLSRLGRPRLTKTRERVLRALERLCAGRETRALHVLGLSPGLAPDLALNRALRTAPTLPARRLYTGVLYDALDLGGMDAAALDRARGSVLIFSGLWGVLGVDDAVPPYRLSMGVALPRLGGLAALWRPVLTKQLDAEAAGRLVLDLRSSTYAGAWRPAGDAADRTVAVRVLRETLVDGVPRRSVVSHMAKHTRGELAGALLRAGTSPETPDELAKAAGELGFTTELTPPPRPDRPWTLDIVIQT